MALALAALPSRGAAQANPERARELFEQGVTAMDSGNPGLAAQYFNESYQLFPRASTACNMALSLERTGRGCDAESWYRQCAVLDQEGRFRDHANRQASALGAQCQPNQAQNPFVAQATVSTGPPAPSNVQVIEQRPVGVSRGADHTLLGVGIAGLVLSGGALAGAIGLASAAQSERNLLAELVPPGDPANPTPLVPGTPAADHYSQAGTLSTAAIALYAVSGVLGGVSVILILVDLAQPGVFGGAARSGDAGAGLRFAIAPTVGGAFGQLELRF